MRQWGIPPNQLCDQHLLGEHVEHHMFVGALLKGISVDGYIQKGLFEEHNVYKRHDRLVKEMIARGMNHQSPLPKVKLRHLGKLDLQANAKELFRRCTKCRARMRSK